MGLASWLGFQPKTPAPQVYWQQSLDVGNILNGVLAQPVETLWREQPHLRTVVGFIARNIAHLGWHVYERDDADDGRNRVREGPLVDLLMQPNAQSTSYELVYATMGSLCLYDTAFWWVGQDINSPSGWVIRHIPTSWVIGTKGNGPFDCQAYVVALPEAAGKWVEIPADEFIVFHGWDPVDPRGGVSPVYALKTILAEQISAQIYREQMWKRGGRVGSYIYRPAEAPPWADDVRTRWVDAYRDAYSGDDAPRAGGEPLFEDGMELRRVGFSAKDDQFIEASKLSLETVAQVYHINPTMIGLLDNANYSNVREFRRMLYGDTLGPHLEQMQQRINSQLVPRFADAKRVYVEFNLNAKLAGSFEEQAAVMQSAIGSPWMTVNEGRARQNMPAIEGGDELIRPLNLSQPGAQNPIPAEAEPTDEPVPELEAPTQEAKRNGHSLDRGIHVRV